MIDAVGSLCSGVGGLDRAVSAHLGLPIAWHCENAEGPAEVLKVRMPAPNHGDLTVIDWAYPLRPRVLAMGVPCQPTSSAGLRLGDADPRWLWPYARAAVDVLRPEWIAFENVAGLVSHDKGRLWRGILADLGMLGYSVAWGVFGACLAEVGGCHHRHRVFMTARRAGAPSVTRWDGKACGVPPRRTGILLPTPITGDAVRGITNDGREYAGHSRTTDLGAAVAHTPAGRLLPTPTTPVSPNGHGARGGSYGNGHQSGVNLEAIAKAEAFGRYAWAVERWAARFGAPPAPTHLGPRGGVQLVAPFPEWMMGYRSGYVTDVLGRTDALKAIGNAVFPLQAYVALGILAPLLRT